MKRRFKVGDKVQTTAPPDSEQWDHGEVIAIMGGSLMSVRWVVAEEVYDETDDDLKIVLR